MPDAGRSPQDLFSNFVQIGALPGTSGRTPQIVDGKVQT
jgi:hypothetical protein